METGLALVHSRPGTNTFPSWDRAHPCRYPLSPTTAESTPLRGNINWMHARQALFTSKLFGEDMQKILPVINPQGSDSAMFRQHARAPRPGRPPAGAAVMMMIPEPWSYHQTMDDRPARLLPVPLLPDGALGRPRRPSPSPTASRWARCSTTQRPAASRYPM